MNEKYLKCARCHELSEFNRNFCWQCGLEFSKTSPSISGRTSSRTAKVAAGVGLGISGILAGALGGVVVGILIMIAMILSFLNAIAEIFDGCAGTLLFFSLMVTTAIYSLVCILF